MGAAGAQVAVDVARRRACRVRRVRALGPYVLFLALAAPFAGKALHIDDTLFVNWARHVRAKPSAPLDYTVVWNGQRARMVDISPNPPLHAYVLAAAPAFTGGADEVVLHLWLLPFGLLGLWAVGVLARRFGVAEEAARWLVAASPVLVLASHSLMPDLTVFGLGTAAMALGVRALDEGRVRDGVVSGLLLALAILVRYNAGVLAVVLGLYAVAVRRPLARLGWPLGLAGGLAGTWVVFVTTHGGGGHFESVWTLGDGRSVASVAWGAGAGVVLLGGVVLVPPAMALVAWANRRARWAVLACFAALTAVCAWFSAKGALVGASVPWLLPLLGTAGLTFAARVVYGCGEPLLRWRTSGQPSREHLFLAAWMFSVLLLPTLYIHVAAKYLLPALAPIVILFLRAAPLRGRGVALVASAGAALSLLLGLADRHLADLAPRVAREVAAPLLQKYEGKRTVWSTIEWGYAHYLPRAGAKLLHEGARPRAGDLILATDTTPQFELAKRMKLPVVEVARHVYPSRLPFVTMHAPQGAGYYSHHWGYLPFAVVPIGTPLEAVRVLVVTSDVDTQP